MRLIKFNDEVEFHLTRDIIHNIPEYAVLSHTWGADTEEVSFQDLIDDTRHGRDKPGWAKLKFCADQARRDGLRYFWVDSCCINKSDNNELSRSINSMFRWYQNATRCYVYLSGISSASDRRDRIIQGPAFRSHRWFTRGWTLQELIAPQSVEFFTQDGLRLGDKRTLEQEIHEITGIAVPALQGTTALSEFSVEARFSWAENRQTTHEEDWAYSLLGIFGVFMPLIYGEGKAHAVRRLKKEILDAASQADDAIATPHQRSTMSSGPGPRTVTAISSDSLGVYRWDGQQWAQIGNATAALYGGGFALLGTDAVTHDVSIWTTRNNWIKLGGPGAKFVVTAISVYGLTPHHDAVFKWNHDGTDWKRIAGPTGDLFGGGYNAVFRVSAEDGDVYRWISDARWEKVGGSGAEFAVNGQGKLYGLTSGKDAVFEWTGTGQTWAKVGGPAARLFAGGLGVFVLNPSGSEIWRYRDYGLGGWEGVGGPMRVVDLAVADDDLFALNDAGEVWKWEGGAVWTNLGAPLSKQIVASV